MSDLNYSNSRKQEYRASFVMPDATQPPNRYIQNQHLSTPPSYHRFKNGTLQQGRQFVNFPQSSATIGNVFQLPQINTIYSPYKDKPLTQPFSISSLQYSSPQNKSSYQFKPNTPINAYYNNSQSDILMIYQAKKNEYVNRVRRLQDHVELNFPDGGKYIGQVLHGDIDRIKDKLSCIKHGQGIFFYANGDFYFGSWKDDLFEGQGVYMFTTGEVYDGMLSRSQKKGRGTYYYQNATAFYSGTWENDLKHGIGVIDSPQLYYDGQWKQGLKHGNGYEKNKINHFVYIGEYHQGIKQGRGRIVNKDGSTYAGEFANELPHGVGDFQYPNKDKYIGQFFEGKKHGKGNYFFSQGTVFSGRWENDFKVQGQLTLFNGDVFNGIFRNNQRYQGKYRYRNGDLYEGTWKDDIKDGYGKLYLENGQKYEGQFVSGQKHGEGIYTWKNGDRYEGQFSYDKRQGLGEYYWSDGGFYKGEWKADRMNGFGRLVKDGVDVIGEFFADHFQRPIQEYELGAIRNFVLS